jgi:hypothetical protein
VNEAGNRDTPQVGKTPNRGEGRAKRWEWLDRPVTLWALTTIAVGLMGFLYSNYSACRVAQSADEDKLMRLVYEMAGRGQRIIDVWPADKDSQNYREEMLRKAVDPDQTYVFIEFKSKLPMELRFEAQRLMAKWGLWETTIIKLGDRSGGGTDDNQADGGAEGTDGGRAVDKISDSLKFTSEYATLPQDAAAIESINKRVNQLKVDSDDAITMANNGLIEPSTCVGRAFWLSSGLSLT